MAGKIIYTLGTSNRDWKEFREILKHYNIEVLIDVRRFPTSSFEHFKKENLEKLKDIDYIYLGKELGGYRKEGYQAYMRSFQFREGLKRVEDLAQIKRVCIFCSERYPFRCHRRFIGFALEDLGWRVVHIINKDKVYSYPRGKNG